MAVAFTSWAAAALAFGLVMVLLRTGGWRRNRLLIGILAIEAGLQLSIGTGRPAATRPLGLS